MSETPDERHAVRRKRWGVEAARRAEVRRLLDVAGSALPKLRVLTVTCAKDHKLVDVYRIDGRLVWKGGSRVARLAAPPAFSVLGRHNAGQTGLIDGDTDRSWLTQPAGSCACGGFGMTAGWLSSQVERTDLPKSRRVTLVLNRR